MEILGHTFVKSAKQVVLDSDLSGKCLLEEKGYHQSNRINDESCYYVKPAQAIVFVLAKDGDVVQVDLRNQICQWYQLKILKKPRFEKFLREIFEGILDLAEVEHHRFEIRQPEWFSIPKTKRDLVWIY